MFAIQRLLSVIIWIWPAGSYSLFAQYFLPNFKGPSSYHKQLNSSIKTKTKRKSVASYPKFSLGMAPVLGDLTVTTASSPPPSITPPVSDSSPDRGSPPSSQVEVQLPPSRSVVTSPFTVSREYPVPFSHIHTQPGQVRSLSFSCMMFWFWSSVAAQGASCCARCRMLLLIEWFVLLTVLTHLVFHSSFITEMIS